MTNQIKHNKPEYPRRSKLPGIAVGALIGLLIWPQTREVVGPQLRLLLPTQAGLAAASPRGFTDPAVAEYASSQIAETQRTQPDSFRIQLAAAMNPIVRAASEAANTNAKQNPASDLSVSALKALAPRFSDKPSLYAAILRFSTIGQVRITRHNPLDPKPSAPAKEPEVHSSPENISQFITYCESGQRLDPDNGLFPMLKAVALFEANRDNEAILSMDRAAACGHWSEYLDDELFGDVDLQKTAFGNCSSIAEATYGAGILLPHYASIRSASRLALSMAIEAEKRGDVDQGVAIRKTVLHCGSLMMYNSRLAIGSLVGGALVSISMSRPGGDVIAPDKNLEWHEAQQQHAEAFFKYLDDHKHVADVPAFRERMDGLIRIKQILQHCSEVAGYDTYMISDLELQIADNMLLSATLWTAAYAGLFLIGSKLSKSAAIRGLNSTRRKPLGIVASIASLAGTTALLVWHTNTTVGLFTGMGVVWFGPDTGFGQHVWLQRVCDYYTYIVAGVPCLTLLTFGVLSAIWRVPVTVGIARAMKGCIEPICTVLILTYAVTAGFTARTEHRLSASLDQTLQHEGIYVAEQIGLPWPEEPR